MLAAAAAHNIFRDWLTYVTATGVALSVWGGIYIKVIYPRGQAHKKHEAERAELRAENQRLNDRLNALPDQMGLVLWWIAVHEKECSCSH